MDSSASGENLCVPVEPNKKNKMAICDNQPRCKAIRPLGSLLVCGGCRSEYYCNAKCQRQAWTKGKHSEKCEAKAAKYRRKLEKKKKQYEKLRKAKKQAEASNSSFNASMTLMFMDSDSEDDDDGNESSSYTTDHLGSSRLSFSEKETGGGGTRGSKSNLDSSFNIAGLSLEPDT